MVDQNSNPEDNGGMTKGTNMKAISTYVNEQGVTVTVYPEKKVKRRAWMRGEGYCGAKMRIPEDGERMFATFSRKNGKY